MEIFDVRTGEVMTASGTSTIRTTAIGSCVAVVAYDAGKKVGGIAHVMLPGKAPPKCNRSELTRYTTNAIDEMLSRMIHMGARRDDINTAMVGGANVLQREDDVVCSNNITSVTNYLTGEGVCIHKKVVGGIKRRSVSLDVELGLMCYSEGDNSSVSHSLAGQKGAQKAETDG